MDRAGCDKSQLMPRGTTLLETVIASGLLAMVILAVFSALLSSDTLDVAAREEQIARAAATAVIDRIRGTSFLNVEPQYGQDPEVFSQTGNRVPYKVLIDMTELNRSESQLVEGQRGVGVLNVYILTSPIFFANGTAVDENVIGMDLDGRDSNGDGVIANDVVNLMTLADPNDPSRLMFPFTFKSSLGADLYPIVVTVRWVSILGGRRKINVMTMITDRTGRGG
ncbi:MAG: hypothetical protein N3A38_08390 [Planctomycetota bacterium]|nr:hypothetical protein [Planctomycetota bacterium]